MLVFSPSTKPNSAYAPKDYITVVLEKRLGQGAVGEVFRAVIQPDGSSKKPRYCPFVVKMATTASRIQRLRHEYKVYEHLRKVDVTGIPTVLGFRETPNSSMCVLLLSHVGRPLGARMNSDRKVKLTAKQRYVQHDPSYKRRTQYDTVRNCALFFGVSTKAGYYTGIFVLGTSWSTTSITSTLPILTEVALKGPKRISLKRKHVWIVSYRENMSTKMRSLGAMILVKYTTHYIEYFTFFCGLPFNVVRISLSVS